MNAYQFIKENGVEKARKVVEGAPELAEYYSTIDGEYYRIEINAVNLKQLKRLVESVDLVGEYGGIINAKHDVKYLDLDWDYDTPRVTRLKQAISDYEQLFGNTETSELETLRNCDTSPNCKKYDERVK